MRSSASLFSGSTIVPTFTGSDEHPLDGAASLPYSVILARKLRRRTGSSSPVTTRSWFAEWYVRPTRTRGGAGIHQPDHPPLAPFSAARMPYARTFEEHLGSEHG